ncbi:MAG: hypothetical protein E6Q35_02325 [Chryseobacterium cucumeris]|nr:MAG: hypothetical protein E6Q35_02325 [Chryseobacterium cucumeris]
MKHKDEFKVNYIMKISMDISSSLQDKEINVLAVTNALLKALDENKAVILPRDADAVWENQNNA